MKRALNPHCLHYDLRTWIKLCLNTHPSASELNPHHKLLSSLHFRPSYRIQHLLSPCQQKVASGTKYTPNSFRSIHKSIWQGLESNRRRFCLCNRYMWAQIKECAELHVGVNIARGCLSNSEHTLLNGDINTLKGACISFWVLSGCTWMRNDLGKI